MIIRKCSTKGAFEALPEKNTQLNLEKVRKYFKVIASTPFLIIIKDRYEVSCFKNGKLLIKNCPKKEQAEMQAERIYNKLYQK